jgi:hypothetical protein
MKSSPCRHAALADLAWLVVSLAVVFGSLLSRGWTPSLSSAS